MRAPPAGVWRARPTRENPRVGGRKCGNAGPGGTTTTRCYPANPRPQAKTQAGRVPPPPSPHTPSTPTLPPCPPTRARPQSSFPRRQENLDASRLQQPPRLPCFPLSESHLFPPRPSAHVRTAASQIRFVPLFRPFQHPQRGPRPLIRPRAWHIRLVSLCPLVRRASNPSCAGLFQAQAAPKKHSAQFNSIQTAPAPPPPCGLGYLHSQWHNGRAVTNPLRCVSRRR